VTHDLHPELAASLQRAHAPLRVLQVGAGGNGSKLLMGLHHLHEALVAYGFAGLHVTLADGDTVSESNLARQSFWPADLGRNKATTLIGRLNLAAGHDWVALPEHLTARHQVPADVVISCVDSRAARAIVAERATDQNRSYHQQPYYWIDLGNTSRGGQVVLGQPANARNRPSAKRLRCAHELFPEIADATQAEDDAPSCGTIEAIERQDLFLNDMLANQALNLLWNLLRYRSLSTHGAFVTSSTGLCTPIPIEPRYWRRLARRARPTPASV
jgi:PRTRC genetic system ThiF family protein